MAGGVMYAHCYSWWTNTRHRDNETPGDSTDKQAKVSNLWKEVFWTILRCCLEYSWYFCRKAFWSSEHRFSASQIKPLDTWGLINFPNFVPKFLNMLRSIGKLVVCNQEHPCTCQQTNYFNISKRSDGFKLMTKLKMAWSDYIQKMAALNGYRAWRVFSSQRRSKRGRPRNYKWREPILEDIRLQC